MVQDELPVEDQLSVAEELETFEVVKEVGCDWAKTPAHASDIMINMFETTFKLTAHLNKYMRKGSCCHGE